MLSRRRVDGSVVFAQSSIHFFSERMTKACIQLCQMGGNHLSVSHFALASASRKMLAQRLRDGDTLVQIEMSQ